MASLPPLHLQTTSLNDIADAIIHIPDETMLVQPLLSRTEIDSRRVFAVAGLHPYKSRLLKYGIPLLVNLILGTACFSPLWYPKYYVHQTEIWTAHLVLIIPCYNYILVQRYKWQSAIPRDHVAIQTAYRAISLFFYWLFMAYCGYFMGYMFYFNRSVVWPYQIGNVVMCAAWYLFFAISSATFYFTATMFLQRARYIKSVVKRLKGSTNITQDLYTLYDIEFKKNRSMGRVWNRIVFIVLVVLAANIPIDFIAIYVKKAYFDIPSVIVKVLGLTWYLLTICKVNHMETYLLSYLRKHYYLEANIEQIEEYIRVRPIGLNFYGIRITYDYVTKAVILIVNLLIPTLYGLVQNHVL
jgi:hypothetical protein